MIRIAIVEDEAPFAQQLTEYLHRYEKEKQENFAVTRYTDGDEIVENYKAQFDIVTVRTPASRQAQKSDPMMGYKSYLAKTSLEV